ncbi:alpha/beta hydrolase [Pseudodesulfovibrio sp.]|uniref:alpha/beta hydrolase n=1 Tax=unclassified Pseudodesulfovibrio TaxID=2661612 RepID=UPI003AFFF584
MKFWLILLILAVFIYAAAAARIWFGQRRILFRPRRELEGTPADAGLKFEEVWLKNRLGTRIHGWFVPCVGAERTLLFQHGNGGNISHRLPSLRLFHNLGLSVLLIDYSGYGQSEGYPTEAALLADARAAWDHLMKQGTTPDQIIVFGRSLGGAVAAGLARELAGEGINPAGLVLESTFTSAAAIGAQRYPWLPVRLLIRDRFDSLGALNEVGVRALFAHSPDDDVVPWQMGRELYEKYQGPKSFLTLSGGHNQGYLEMGPAYPDGLSRYLKNLDKAGKSFPNQAGNNS